MKIVRPTSPPSMSVIVDTVIAGQVELILNMAHPVHRRIDLIFACDGMVGVLAGVAAASPITPTLSTQMRALAKVHILPATPWVPEGAIEEL